MIEYFFAEARKRLYLFDNILATKEYLLQKREETTTDFSISILGKLAVKGVLNSYS